MKMKRMTAMLCAGMLACSGAVAAVLEPCAVFADGENEEEKKAWDGSYDTSWYDAQDTELHIFSASELAGLAYLVNSGGKTFEGQTVYLESDVDLAGAKWTPIGQSDGHETTKNNGTFKGAFDGNNHTVSNLTCLPNDHWLSKAGLFGCCSAGTIKNLSLENCHTSGLANGCICSYLFDGGVIENCKVTGILENGEWSVGGIVGIMVDSSVKNCFADISINSLASTADNYVSGAGGICGKIRGSSMIDGCISSGTILRSITHDESQPASKRPYSIVGGICGCSADADDRVAVNNWVVKNSCSHCSLEAISSKYSNGKYENYFYGIAGGIVGRAVNGATLENVYNTGEVKCTGIAQGVIGKTEQETQIINAYYLSSTAASGGGYGEDACIAKSATNMKKEAFAQSLGDAFVFQENSFPRLLWETQTAEIVTGDVSGDGKIGADDAQFILQYYVNHLAGKDIPWKDIVS